MSLAEQFAHSWQPVLAFFYQSWAGRLMLLVALACCAHEALDWLRNRASPTRVTLQPPPPPQQSGKRRIAYHTCLLGNVHEEHQYGLRSARR